MGCKQSPSRGNGDRAVVFRGSAATAGTIRTFSKENQRIAREALSRRVQKIAESHEVKAEVAVGSGGYDMIISNPSVTKALVSAFDAAAAGMGGAYEMPQPSMASDDFGYLGSTGIPTVFWRLQASPFADKPGAPNYSPEFVLDERAMKVGVRAYVAAALQYMTAKSVASR